LLFLSGPACEMTNASSYPLSPNPHHSDTKSANKILVHIFRINQESGRRRHNAARHHHQERRSDVVAPAGDQNIFHLLPFSEYISRRARVCCREAITKRERGSRATISLSGSQGCQKCEWANERECARGAIIALSGVDARVNNDTLIKITMQQCWLAGCTAGS